MTQFNSRLNGEGGVLSCPMICDAWVADGYRFGDEYQGLESEPVIGRWPDDLETDAVVRLVQSVNKSTSWGLLAATPPVAQKLAERARPQPLDLEIYRHLQHLQHVCHTPRLHLKIEEERLPVSRARRTPVRAVADLVSHPGDWEHRTLRSILPSRVLARQIDDEWNLYENFVAVRLVDNLLAYLASRLEDLRKIEDALLKSRDNSDETRTSFWRARRIMTLWAGTLTNKTEDELRGTIRRLELAQRDLQSLLGSPLYQRIPKRQSVALSLKPTNILVNDLHYRKVAALWRTWVTYGHKCHETSQKRAERRQLVAASWDNYVLHLVVRAFDSLKWKPRQVEGSNWILTKDGWLTVNLFVDKHGVVKMQSGERTLFLLPLCAHFGGTESQALTRQLEAWDVLDGELVAVHVGETLDAIDVDRAVGWSFGRRTVMLGCSPWGIDSEERMARLVNGWLNRATVSPYPVAKIIRALPSLPQGNEWLRYEGGNLLALRAPNQNEIKTLRSWGEKQAKELDVKAQQAKLARQAFEVAPREAITEFQQFIENVGLSFVGLDQCPVCGKTGHVTPQPGKKADGSDATWWAKCNSCDSEWGLKSCASCGKRYRALVVQAGIDLVNAAGKTDLLDWPDKILGRDVWAQPCRSGAAGHFRCPDCGTCSRGICERCNELR